MNLWSLNVYLSYQKFNSSVTWLMIVRLFSIVDRPTCHDRFVRVVQWYLSVFHAGRRSSIAKKPYNPILGEIFRCYYELPDDSLEKVCAAL